jgi:hypothetical protein
MSAIERQWEARRQPQPEGVDPELIVGLVCFGLAMLMLFVGL